MKKKRFKAEQIVTILMEAERDGATVVEVCRAHGVSDATFYRWKKVYGGMDVTCPPKTGPVDMIESPPFNPSYAIFKNLK